MTSQRAIQEPFISNASVESVADAERGCLHDLLSARDARGDRSAQPQGTMLHLHRRAALQRNSGNHQRARLAACARRQTMPLGDRCRPDLAAARKQRCRSVVEAVRAGCDLLDGGKADRSIIGAGCRMVGRRPSASATAAG